mgnify:CR=1 FL=1
MRFIHDFRISVVVTLAIGAGGGLVAAALILVTAACKSSVALFLTGFLFKILMTIINISDIFAEVEWKDIKNIHLTIYPPDARVHISALLYLLQYLRKKLILAFLKTSNYCLQYMKIILCRLPNEQYIYK